MKSANKVVEEPPELREQIRQPEAEGGNKLLSRSLLAICRGVSPRSGSRCKGERDIITPAPKLPLPAAARMSCPWHDTARWRWTARRGLAQAGQSWHIRYQGRGGSAPGGGACPA